MPDYMDPRSRKEVFLKGVLDGDTPDLNPNDRIELYLKAIAEASVIDLAFNETYTQLSNADVKVSDILTKAGIVFLTDWTISGDYPDLSAQIFDIVYIQVDRYDFANRNIVIKNRYTGDLWSTGFVSPETVLTFTPVTP